MLLASERFVSGNSASPRLIAVEGYRPLALLQHNYPNARIQLHPTPYSALAALQLGEAELFLGNALSSRYLLARGQLPGLEWVDQPVLQPSPWDLPCSGTAAHYPGWSMPCCKA